MDRSELRMLVRKLLSEDFALKNEALRSLSPQLAEADSEEEALSIARKRFEEALTAQGIPSSLTAAKFHEIVPSVKRLYGAHKALRGVFSDHAPASGWVKTVIVYGSTARGDAIDSGLSVEKKYFIFPSQLPAVISPVKASTRQKSDTDLLVVFDDKAPASERAWIAKRMAKSLGLHHVLSYTDSKALEEIRTGKKYLLRDRLYGLHVPVTGEAYARQLAKKANLKASRVQEATKKAHGLARFSSVEPLPAKARAQAKKAGFFGFMLTRSWRGSTSRTRYYFPEGRLAQGAARLAYKLASASTAASGLAWKSKQAIQGLPVSARRLLKKKR